MEQVQHSFERYEKKYLLTPAQYEALLPRLRERMTEDEYGMYTICNIYYDTEDYSLIRTSLSRPAYKEKLRIRSYEQKCGDGRGSGRGFQPGAVPADRTMRAEIPGKRISEKN